MIVSLFFCLVFFVFVFVFVLFHYGVRQGEDIAIFTLIILTNVIIFCSLLSSRTSVRLISNRLCTIKHSSGNEI